MSDNTCYRIFCLMRDKSPRGRRGEVSRSCGVSNQDYSLGWVTKTSFF